MEQSYFGAESKDIVQAGCDLQQDLYDGLFKFFEVLGNAQCIDKNRHVMCKCIAVIHHHAGALTNACCIAHVIDLCTAAMNLCTAASTADCTDNILTVT